MPVIGFLNVASPEAWRHYVAAFKNGLSQAGFVDGQNVTIENRWAYGDYSRLPALVAELVGLRVSVIAATGGSRSALAAKAATETIPIVFLFGDGDPVKHGLVASINRPGGNVTGITMVAGLLEPKRLELLREMVPNTSTVHILVNPNNAGILQDIPAVAAIAGKMGLGFDVVQAGTESEIESAFATLNRDKAQALMVAKRTLLGTVRSRTSDDARIAPAKSGRSSFDQLVRHGRGGLRQLRGGGDLEVLRLIANANLVGCSAGRSAAKRLSELRADANARTADRLRRYSFRSSSGHRLPPERIRICCR